MFAQVRRCLPLSQRKLLIWRKRLRIWFCKLQLISLRCCRGNTKSFRSLQFVYLEFSRTLVNLNSFPLFHPFYLMSMLARLLEGSLVLVGRQIQTSHSRLHSNRNTSSCRRRQRRQQRQSRRSVRWQGRQDLLGKSISTQTEAAVGVCLLYSHSSCLITLVTLYVNMMQGSTWWPPAATAVPPPPPPPPPITGRDEKYQKQQENGKPSHFWASTLLTQEFSLQAASQVGICPHPTPGEAEKPSLDTKPAFYSIFAGWL